MLQACILTLFNHRNLTETDEIILLSSLIHKPDSKESMKRKLEEEEESDKANRNATIDNEHDDIIMLNSCETD